MWSELSLNKQINKFWRENWLILILKKYLKKKNTSMDEILNRFEIYFASHL